MDIRNFSMGLTAKGAIWYSYTTTNNTKVASGGTGPAHADSFAAALAAAGIVAPATAADDLADVVAAQTATIAQLRANMADLVPLLDSRDAQIAALTRQLAQADDLHAQIVGEFQRRLDCAGAGSQPIDASEIARNATDTANRAAAVTIGERDATIADLTARLAAADKAISAAQAQCDAARTLAGADRVAAWLAPQSEAANG